MANKLGIPSANNFVPLTDGSTMPAGTIISYAGSIAAFTSTAMADSTTLIHKDGWAVCNGASIPKATYSQLFARVSTTWNAATNPLTGSAQSAPADATNNFRIPNLQGTFLRGVGDFTDNTKDTTLGGFQTDQFQLHRHQIATTSGSATGATAKVSLIGSDQTGNGAYSGGDALLEYNSGGTPRAGTESRPQNVGVYYLIKLYDNLAAVDVYVPSASAGVSGIVDNSAGNTAGTPIKGKTDGAVAQYYVGETKQVFNTSNISSLSDTWTYINVLTGITKGNWLIGYSVPITDPTGITGAFSRVVKVTQNSDTGNVANSFIYAIDSVAGSRVLSKQFLYTATVDLASIELRFKTGGAGTMQAGPNATSTITEEDCQPVFYAIRMS